MKSIGFLTAKIGLPLVAVLIILYCTVHAQDTPKITKPVPVVPTKNAEPEIPKKEEPLPVAKQDTGPLVSSEEVAGILPLSFVKNKLDVMPTGTKAYIAVDGIKCDSKRRVFLDPDQVYGTQNEGRVVLISKDTTGYHLSLDKVEHQWTCQELPTNVKWISVKTISSR